MSETVQIRELAYTALATVGLLTNLIVLWLSVRDLRALESRKLNGELKVSATSNLRRALQDVYACGFIILVGVVGMTRPARPFTLVQVVVNTLFFGYIAFTINNGLFDLRDRRYLARIAGTKLRRVDTDELKAGTAEVDSLKVRKIERIDGREDN